MVKFSVYLNRHVFVMFAFLHTQPLLKGSPQKVKNLLSGGQNLLPESKLFSFRIDPFQMKGRNNTDRVASLESVSIPFNSELNYSICIQFKKVIILMLVLRCLIAL